MSIQDKIETIKNLLNKNENNGATEEEAMQSIALAKKLMSKYSITMDDLKKQNIDTDDFVFGSNGNFDERNRVSSFESIIVNSVAGYTNTVVHKTFYKATNSKNKDSVYTFFGYAVDVELAVYIMNKCKAAFDYEWSIHKKKTNMHGNKKKVFGIGMGTRISKRLDNMSFEEATNSTDLIVIKNQLVLNLYDAACENVFTESKVCSNIAKFDKNKQENYKLFMDGYDAGDNVVLTHEFEKKKTLMIGE